MSSILSPSRGYSTAGGGDYKNTQYISRSWTKHESHKLFNNSQQLRQPP